MTIKEGDFIQINYTGSADNAVFDTTEAIVAKEAGIFSSKTTYGPVTIVVGERHVIKGLDEGLVGKELGKHSFDIEDIDAFGKKDAKKLQLLPTKVFTKENINPYPGLQVNIDDTIGVVRSVSGGRTIVDFNHPLSSKTVHYDVDVLKIVDDTKEQIQAFFDIMGAKIEDITLSEDKAVIKTQAPLPEPFTKPLGEDISRLTGIKTIEFVNTRDLKESDVVDVSADEVAKK